jgi:hypothetical protein
LILLRDELSVFANGCLAGTVLYVKELNIPVGTGLCAEIFTGKTSPKALLEVTGKAKVDQLEACFIENVTVPPG